MRTKEILETTTCSATYHKALKDHLFHYGGLCDRCGFHRGCNRSNNIHGESSWKNYRKHQWKD